MKSLGNVLAGGFCLLVIGGVVWLFADKFREVQAERAFYRNAAQGDPSRHRATPEEKLACWRAGADAAAVRFVTNSVTGFRRMIFCSTLTLDPAVSNWTGLAEVEFINRVGGVEKQALYLRFHTIDGTLFAGPDWVRDQKEFEASVLKVLVQQK